MQRIEIYFVIQKFFAFFRLLHMNKLETQTSSTWERGKMPPSLPRLITFLPTAITRWQGCR